MRDWRGADRRPSDGKIKATRSLRSIWAASLCLHIAFDRLWRHHLRCTGVAAIQNAFEIKAPGDTPDTSRPGFGQRRDLSIPDQRRQAKGYCASRDWKIVADYVEPGASATDDRRPEFLRMIDAATTKPPAFDVILVHSFSRFFRDQFQLEFYVRRLAKNGVRLVSITQELGDDPMSNMIRQIMALFDEYQSRENAKHTLRAMKENARQGFWNGALPPIGYRIVEATEQRGHRTKKTLEIDPIQAETVRLIFRLACQGNGSSGPMGVKSIAKHLNESGIRTRDGGRWGVDAVHKVLTRTP